MPMLILVVEAESAASVEVRGGRLTEIPFEADPAALEVVRALSRLADGDLLDQAGPPANESAPRPPRRRAG
jgi:hypothetical protein